MSGGNRKDVLWYLTKGNLKMVLTDGLLFVVCSCMEFPWDASIILESMDSEENCERKKRQRKENQTSIPNISQFQGIFETLRLTHSTILIKSRLRIHFLL